MSHGVDEGRALLHGAHFGAVQVRPGPRRHGPKPGWQASPCRHRPFKPVDEGGVAAEGDVHREKRYRSLSASFTPRLTKAAAKTFRIQPSTRGRDKM
jgi:hypothetical protein